MISDDLVCNSWFQTSMMACWSVAVAATFIWTKVSLRSSSNTNVLASSKSLLKHSNKKISVVLPVKGVHARTTENWKTQIASSVGAEMEFIFVMESVQDPAYEAALKFKKSMEGTVAMKVLVAGESFHCSQKIHNLLVGVKQVDPRSTYVLLLDDDAEMSSTVLGELVTCLDADPRVLVASGWPHEYISPGTTPRTFACYMLLGYRLFSYLGIPFKHTKVLWGGCLLLRYKDLVSPEVGILEGWRQCGYSDDMIVGGRAHRLGMYISIPPKAMLPAKMDVDYSFARHWNYMHRQMFVLDTYADNNDRLVNLVLLLVVSFCLLIFIWFNLQVMASLGFFSLCARMLDSDGRALLARRLTQGWDGDARCGVLNVAPEFVLVLNFVLFSMAFGSGLVAHWSITRMCERVTGRRGLYTHTVNPFLLAAGTFLGLAAQCLMQGIASLVALLSDRVVWSGTTYIKRG
eukprot:CAMPEP_0113698228 /NCGR_PEP_ID=MMETSP0038_2-20120614/22589_1 /TAXON_ID=2898 /ORGANISM="Cryptomonas paramecium" /LENGTH=460 /DNA_ID=CAMNT_0000621359 /DNA_START=79 /DNA_END=1457 /DNA_ORIENTATION=- /assembly_acc=CAM_ASM_000170